MLLEQRMDVAIGNKAVFRYLARRADMLPHIKFVYDLGSEPLYLMFSRKRGQVVEKLAQEFGRTIREMRRDGTFKRIEEKY